MAISKMRAGHSLGGALATLAAYEFRAAARAHGKDLNIACYTFGAPRVGNHAFAHEFDEVGCEVDDRGPAVDAHCLDAELLNAERLPPAAALWFVSM